MIELLLALVKHLLLYMHACNLSKSIAAFPPGTRVEKGR